LDGEDELLRQIISAKPTKVIASLRCVVGLALHPGDHNLQEIRRTKLLK
jgi:hypothetical protein